VIHKTHNWNSGFQNIFNINVIKFPDKTQASSLFGAYNNNNNDDDDNNNNNNNNA
jgi:hypothetical protein